MAVDSALLGGITETAGVGVVADGAAGDGEHPTATLISNPGSHFRLPSIVTSIAPLPVDVECRPDPKGRVAKAAIDAAGQ